MTGGYVLDWPEARRRKSDNRYARWDSVIGEFDGEVWPEVQPSFRIKPGDTVFTIGSCFARNIETHLEALGCKVPMLSLDFPTEELHGQPRSAMNRFHPPAFRQCLEWAAAIHDRDGRVSWDDCAPMAVDCGGESFFDMDMAGALPVPRTRFVERRQRIYDIFSTVFSAQCMMMTPGLVEAFRDRTTGLYLYGAPSNKAMLSQPDRWEYEVLSFERCLQDMLASIDVVRARNPEIKILVTTSPVPLGVTFSGRDIRIANTYSKSVLRAVCDVVAVQRPLVDYFPSYETATLSFPHLAWKRDRLHVSNGLISKIVTRMIDNYLEDVEPAARSYQLALSHLADGDAAEAEAAARAALAERAEHVEAGVVLAEALVRQRRWAEAEAEARRLLDRDPERADVMFKLARALGGQDRPEDAMACLGVAMELASVNQNDVQSVEKLIARAPPDAGLPIARRAVELFPLQVEVYAPLAQLLARAGRKEEAIEVLIRAVSLSKPPAALRLQLAELLAERGQIKQARGHVEKVLASDPKNPAAAALKSRLSGPAAAAALEPSL